MPCPPVLTLAAERRSGQQLAPSHRCRPICCCSLLASMPLLSYKKHQLMGSAMSALDLPAGAASTTDVASLFTAPIALRPSAGRCQTAPVEACSPSTPARSCSKPPAADGWGEQNELRAEHGNRAAHAQSTVHRAFAASARHPVQPACRAVHTAQCRSSSRAERQRRAHPAAQLLLANLLAAGAPRVAGRVGCRLDDPFQLHRDDGMCRGQEVAAGLKDGAVVGQRAGRGHGVPAS